MSIYAVNGKVPVAAWIPSRDTAGNGTTTLNDLVGSNHGTLTNMDPATDWVSDTSNGGVRALDFDGTNDRVLTNAQIATAGDKTISVWVFARSISNFLAVISAYTSNPSSFELHQSLSSTMGGGYYVSGISWSVNATMTANVWQHWTLTQSGNSYSLYRDGSLVDTQTHTGRTATTATTVIGARNTGGFFNGRLDDIRFWNESLNASDVSYLYNSGNGRGRIATSTPINRNNALIGVGF